jgi:hypothetical protein
MSNALTLTQFHQVLPIQAKKGMNQQVLDNLNATLTNMNADPVFMENYRDNLLGFSSVMKDGKFKMESYIDSVRYVSYKLLGDSNIAAYTKTFPQRYQYFITTGTTPKDIASYVSSYNKNKLVNLVWEQSSIPFHVYNQDVRQRALEAQVELMISAKSEKVRSDAANSVLTHLKGPEKTQIELDIGITASTKSIDALQASISALTNATIEKIEDGSMTSEESAHSDLIIEGEVEDAEIVE